MTKPTAPPPPAAPKSDVLPELFVSVLKRGTKHTVSWGVFDEQGKRTVLGKEADMSFSVAWARLKERTATFAHKSMVLGKVQK